MFWRKKEKQPQESLIAFLDEQKRPSHDPEKILSEALAAYETHYYKKISNAVDPEADEAKDRVRKAREFVSNSRLAYAVCRPILEHVKYWPAWSKRGDFRKYCAEPFRYLGGSISDGEKPKTTLVTFSYNSLVYTLKFIDEGIFAWAPDDMNTYGKLEIIVENQTVLGLDISLDLSKGDLAHWWMNNIYALLPGRWMKDIIEMAAHIDGVSTRESGTFVNKDAISRAANIRLPE